jgi:hypothetical protein
LTVKSKGKIYSGTGGGKSALISAKGVVDIAFHALTNAKPPDTNYLVEESKKLNSYIRTLDGFFC